MKMLKKMKNKKGFTLIELIVVIAVIAILAAILLPRFLGFSESARKNAVLSDARNVSIAVQAMVAQGQAFAGDAAADTALVNTYIGNTGLTAGLTDVGADGSFTIVRTPGTIAYTATYNGATGALTVAP